MFSCKLKVATGWLKSRKEDKLLTSLSGPALLSARSPMQRTVSDAVLRSIHIVVGDVESAKAEIVDSILKSRDANLDCAWDVLSDMKALYWPRSPIEAGKDRSAASCSGYTSLHQRQSDDRLDSVCAQKVDISNSNKGRQTTQYTNKLTRPSERARNMYKSNSASTRLAQIVTAAHRDLESCMHRPTNEPWSHIKKGHPGLLYWVLGHHRKYLYVYYLASYWRMVTKFAPDMCDQLTDSPLVRPIFKVAGVKMYKSNYASTRVAQIVTDEHRDL